VVEVLRRVGGATRVDVAVLDEVEHPVDRLDVLGRDAVRLLVRPVQTATVVDHVRHEHVEAREGAGTGAGAVAVDADLLQLGARRFEGGPVGGDGGPGLLHEVLAVPEETHGEVVGNRCVAVRGLQGVDEAREEVDTLKTTNGYAAVPYNLDM